MCKPDSWPARLDDTLSALMASPTLSGRLGSGVRGSVSHESGAWDAGGTDRVRRDLAGGGEVTFLNFRGSFPLPPPSLQLVRNFWSENSGLWQDRSAVFLPSDVCTRAVPVPSWAWAWLASRPSRLHRGLALPGLPGGSRRPSDPHKPERPVSWRGRRDSCPRLPAVHSEQWPRFTKAQTSLQPTAHSSLTCLSLLAFGPSVRPPVPG